MSGNPFSDFAFTPMVKASPDSWWIDAEREGFARLCTERFGEFLDGDSTEEQRVLHQRADLLSAAIAIRQGRSNAAVRRAVILSERN